MVAKPVQVKGVGCLMAQRPGFPLKLEKASPAPRSLKANAAVKSTLQANAKPAPAPVQNLGMDSSAVRQRMVQKLAAQGLQDPLVLQAMADGPVSIHSKCEALGKSKRHCSVAFTLSRGELNWSRYYQFDHFPNKL